MRIVILNTYPVWGGDEKWTINVGRGLSARGHFVVISSRPDSPTNMNASYAGLPTFPFVIGPDIAFWKILPFQRFLRKNDIEVVLCVQNRDVKIGGLAARLAGIPAIFARQGLDMIKNKWDHRFQFKKYIDGIITNTSSIKKLYETYGWFPRDFIHVIYDGVHLPNNIPSLDLRKEFGFNIDSRIIMGSGRLVKQKRFDLLIQVANLSKQRNKNWSFLVAGEGDRRNLLEKMVSELGLTDRVKFTGFRDDVLSLKKGSDIFVLTSDAEGMSNSLKEAMALGIPCIATDVFGVDELFEEGKCGIKVPCRDKNAIFDAIDKLFLDDELRTRISIAARQKIVDDFTMEKMIDDIEQLFRDRLSNNY